ncbi:recombinase-like helix-turn-helix domain-containing protein [Sedimentitalea todarodis]|uniref:recombinase-like helix-turn-helix domain-containing protein n=1 Tax=Sedimentitalea todarodis TaxID=1631240 RepID=UPI00292DF267|nr:recombinase-like helix-turn-helix domain-containing protein [Sedimentitalea todarodis]
MTANADAFASGLSDTVTSIQTEGHETLRAMADELNARGILTRQAKRWHVSSVRNLLKRLESL